MRGLPFVNRNPIFFFSRHGSAFADPTGGAGGPLFLLLRGGRFVFTSPNLSATAVSPCFHPHSGFAGAVWGPQFTPGAAISWLELAACLSQAVVPPPMFAVTRTRRFCSQKSAPRISSSRCERIAVAQRLVDFAGHPEAMQKDRKFPSYRHNRSLLCILAARAHMFAPALQISIWSLPAQYAMRSLYKKRTQVHVPLFGNRQLRPSFSRVLAARPQPDKAAYISAFLESVLVFHRQHKGQSNQWSYAADLHQKFRFRIVCPRESLDLLVRRLNLCRQMFHRFEQRPENFP